MSRRGRNHLLPDKALGYYYFIMRTIIQIVLKYTRRFRVTYACVTPLYIQHSFHASQTEWAVQTRGPQ